MRELVESGGAVLCASQNSRLMRLATRRGVTGVCRCGAGDSYGAVHANEHPGLGGHIDLFAFARDNVDGASGETDAKSAQSVAEHRADKRAAARPDRSGDNVTLDVV